MQNKMNTLNYSYTWTKNYKFILRSRNSFLLNSSQKKNYLIYKRSNSAMIKYLPNKVTNITQASHYSK